MALWRRGSGLEPLPYKEYTDVEMSAGQAVTGKCIFRGAIIKTDGVTDVVVTFYDALAASGTKIIDTITIMAGTGTGFIGNIDRICDNGIYVSIAGGTFSWQVSYN